VATLKLAIACGERFVVHTRPAVQSHEYSLCKISADKVGMKETPLLPVCMKNKYIFV
jgi:hypothetical protein